MQLAVILSILVAIGGVLFALQNQMTVTVSFLLWRFDSTLALVILLSLGLGACMVALTSLPAQFRNRWAAARLHKQIESAESAKRQLQERITMLENRLNAPGKPQLTAELEKAPEENLPLPLR
jgi:uncharacterized integral membrane protein